MNINDIDVLDLGAVSTETHGSAISGLSDFQPNTKYVLGGIEAED